MRKIVQTPRKLSESWVEYIQRATHAAEAHCERLGYSPWDKQQHIFKQKLATKMSTGNADKWSARILHWTPWFRTVAWRRIGRPTTRWSDHIEL